MGKRIAIFAGTFLATSSLLVNAAKAQTNHDTRAISEPDANVCFAKLDVEGMQFQNNANADEGALHCHMQRNINVCTVGVREGYLSTPSLLIRPDSINLQFLSAANEFVEIEANRDGKIQHLRIQRYPRRSVMEDAESIDLNKIDVLDDSDRSIAKAWIDYSKTRSCSPQIS